MLTLRVGVASKGRNTRTRLVRAALATMLLAGVAAVPETAVLPDLWIVGPIIRLNYSRRDGQGLSNPKNIFDFEIGVRTSRYLLGKADDAIETLGKGRKIGVRESERRLVGGQGNPVGEVCGSLDCVV